MKQNSLKIARAAMTLAAALILGLVENMLPPVVPAVPFIKLGLSNVAVAFAAIVVGAPYALLTAILKSVLVPLFVGNPIMIAYSLAGGFASCIVTVILIYVKKLSLPFISVLASLTHNFSQLGVAVLMTGSFAVAAYSPVLLLTGTAAGIVTGVIIYVAIKYLPEKILK